LSQVFQAQNLLVERIALGDDLIDDAEGSGIRRSVAFDKG
jgi:hypothetical protein